MLRQRIRPVGEHANRIEQWPCVYAVLEESAPKIVTLDAGIVESYARHPAD